MPSQADRIRATAQGLFSAGLPVNAVSGLLGHIQQESNFNPMLVDRGDRGGGAVGLFQVSNAVWNNWVSYAKANGISPSDSGEQAKFMVGYMQRITPSAYHDLINAQNPRQALNAWKQWNYWGKTGQRYAYADQWGNVLGNGPADVQANVGGQDIANFGGDMGLGFNVLSADQSMWTPPTDFFSNESFQPNTNDYAMQNFAGLSPVESYMQQFGGDMSILPTGNSFADIAALYGPTQYPSTGGALNVGGNDIANWMGISPADLAPSNFMGADLATLMGNIFPPEIGTPQPNTNDYAMQNFGGDMGLGFNVPSADQSMWFSPADSFSSESFQPNTNDYAMQNFGGDMGLGFNVPSADQSMWTPPTDFFSSESFQPNTNDYAMQNFGGDMGLGFNVPSADQSMWFSPADTYLQTDAGYGGPAGDVTGGYGYGPDLYSLPANTLSSEPDVTGGYGFGTDQYLGGSAPTDVFAGAQAGGAADWSSPAPIIDPNVTGGGLSPTDLAALQVAAQQGGTWSVGSNGTPVYTPPQAGGFTNYGAGQYSPSGSGWSGGYAPSNFYQYQYAPSVNTSGSGHAANVKSGAVAQQGASDVWSDPAATHIPEMSGYEGGNAGMGQHLGTFKQAYRLMQGGPNWLGGFGIPNLSGQSLAILSPMDAILQSAGALAAGGDTGMHLTG